MTLELIQLKEMIAKLNEQVEELQERKSITIENVNVTYHFDQLKVDTIEGTLNIGVSPGSKDGMHIEDLDAPHSFPQSMKFSNLQEMRKFQDVRTQVQYTIEQEGEEWLKQSQSHYQCVIGHTYARQMIEDVQAQMDERILFYLRNSDLSTDMVYEKCVEDAKQSLNRHVQSKKEEQETDELENRE